MDLPGSELPQKTDLLEMRHQANSPKQGSHARDGGGVEEEEEDFHDAKEEEDTDVDSDQPAPQSGRTSSLQPVPVVALAGPSNATAVRVLEGFDPKYEP